DDSCFDGGFDANEDSDTNDTFIISLEEKALSGSDYDYYVGLQLGATTFSSAAITFYLKDSDGILAARVYQSGSTPSTFEIVLHSNDDSFYYENKDYDNNRHIRIAASGNFSNKTGKFSSVSSAQFIHSENTLASRSSSVVMMDFNGTTDSYDYYYDNVQDSDYSDTSITHNTDFYNWSGRAITDHDPV